jgi:hypothetical protein
VVVPIVRERSELIRCISSNVGTLDPEKQFPRPLCLGSEARLVSALESSMTGHVFSRTLSLSSRPAGLLPVRYESRLRLAGLDPHGLHDDPGWRCPGLVIMYTQEVLDLFVAWR